MSSVARSIRIYRWPGGDRHVSSDEVKATKYLDYAKGWYNGHCIYGPSNALPHKILGDVDE